MRLAYKMEYIHPTKEDPVIELIKYSSQYQEEYKRIYNEGSQSGSVLFVNNFMLYSSLFTSSFVILCFSFVHTLISSMKR